AQGDRLQPKLTDQLLSLDVNMLGFTAIETIKEKAVRTSNILYRRHLLRILLLPHSPEAAARVYMDSYSGAHAIL
ncbi:MAG: hypothetical protein MN733_11395, partial [Nitrososphaera sp.]|nr:hypothetical protein [Nitrososphaera sp.]